MSEDSNTHIIRYSEPVVRENMTTFHLYTEENAVVTKHHRDVEMMMKNQYFVVIKRDGNDYEKYVFADPCPFLFRNSNTFLSRMTRKLIERLLVKKIV